MEAARQSWTDDRLDDMSARVDRLGERVDRLSDRVDDGFKRVDTDLRELNARFDALQRTLIQVGWTMGAGLLGLAGTIIAAIIAAHF